MCNFNSFSYGAWNIPECVVKGIWRGKYSCSVADWAQEAAADDIVYISEGNSILYEYYKNEISLGSPVVVEHERYNDNLEYVKHLNELKKGKTYYWVFAHHPDKFARLKSVYLWAKEKPDFKMYADRKGNALIRFTIF